MLRPLSPRPRKAQAMVEYALLVVCIAVVGAVAVNMLGHKTQNTLAIAAAIMPGAHTDDNVPIQEVNIIPVTTNANGSLILDAQGLENPDRYADLLGPGNGAILVTPAP